jgi:hypothetical protein
MKSVPVHPDQMSLPFLESIFRAPAGSLTQMTFVPVGTGQMCDSFRLQLCWAGFDGPATIIAKCPSQDDASRNIAKMVRNYELEISWYRDLAASTPVNCPHCYHAEIADNGIDFVLLLDDRSPAKQGDQLAGANGTAMRAAVTELAALHAAHWNGPVLDQYEWLRFGTANKEIVRQLLPVLYTGFRERYAQRLEPAVLVMGQHLVDNIGHYLDAAPAALTVVHSDYRLDNLLFAPDGQVTVVDWQTVGVGAPMADLAYLIGTSIADPAVRADEELRLFDHYFELLQTAGIDADKSGHWRDYRRYAFSGFIMAVFASMNVERSDRGDEMFAVMAERPARQILHLQSADLLQ